MPTDGRVPVELTCRDHARRWRAVVSGPARVGPIPSWTRPLAATVAAVVACGILPAETMTAAPAPTSVGPTAAVATVAILVMGLGTPTVGVLQDGRMTVEVTACGDNA